MTGSPPRSPPGASSARAARRGSLRALRQALQHSDAGTLAQLRRTKPESPPLAFFRVSAGVLDDLLPFQAGARERAESRWAALLQLMAMALGTQPDTGGLLGRVPLGEALARADVAEQRVLRLLEARDDLLADLARGIVGQLVSKGQTFRLDELADLILDPDVHVAETARRRIARDFYRHQSS
ncbi:MAG: type I-E CRISPR-associated protein Cse2/CasB [Proteobacteria bacterium]|nr:type I-E CRISPR-associated protein Cse2/CasB [Pseudomonadota bacterium]